MSALRRTLFWLHLAAGLVAGVAIGVMCVTGAALAFEKQIVAWAERDARRVEIPVNAPRLPLAELAQRLRATHPDARPTAIVVSADPRDAVTFQFGRDAALYANPYTGEVRAPASTRVHNSLHTLEEWHRWLALGGDSRPVGKAVNGACNLAFCFLALSGLYLWWPRSLSWRSVRAVAVFNARLTGKARDFNWHNAVGLWSAPVLVALTLTALPISYRWASNGVFQLFGETPPPPGPAAAPAGPALEIVRPENARPLDTDALLARARALAPNAESFTFRLGNGPGSGSRDTRNAIAAIAIDSSPPTRSAPPPAIVVIREPGTWPRTATTTLYLNPFTAEQLRRESFSDFTPGRRARTWTRFLHTGEALGLVGQLVAGLACLGGGVLVYTGFALSWRRFFPRRGTAAS